MNIHFYPVLCLLLFLFMPLHNYAQEVNKVEFKTIKQQPVIQKAKTSPIKQREKVVVERKNQNFTSLSASNSPQPVQIKERISPTQTVEYWDLYIEKTEKKVAELQTSHPNYQVFKEKLEKSLENAKIRKALISQ